MRIAEQFSAKPAIIADLVIQPAATTLKRDFRTEWRPPFSNVRAITSD
jgi:hypothetical protein